MKLAIIGGGAAGLMAAAAAIETDSKSEVILIEKNDSLGKKVIISGGGRCNLTTGIQDVKLVLTKYPRGSKFLNKAMHRFSPSDIYRWFEAHGVPLKIEADMRVFPQSNDGRDVVGVFEKLFAKAKVRVMYDSQVQGIEKSAKGFKVTIKGQAAPLLADKVILTTGGQAYRQTGSTGDGYGFAASLGHTITDLAPSLSALFTREAWPAKVAGLSFAKAKLVIKPSIPNPFPPHVQGKVALHSTIGPFLFTHKGISGPGVFALSSLAAFEKFDVNQPLEISVDLFPDRQDADLIESIKKLIDGTPKKSLVNVLAQVVPKALSEIVCHELSSDHEKRANETSKKDLARCAAWLKSIPLHVISRSNGEEFVTAGGVDLKEVDPSTLESKLCPGLYFAGEILDIDGFTGGFNLQSAWATGRLAGVSSIK